MSRQAELGISQPQTDRSSQRQLNVLVNHRLVAVINRYVPRRQKSKFIEKLLQRESSRYLG